MRLWELFEDTCQPKDEYVTYEDLAKLEKYLDLIFNRIGVDVVLTGRHFLDRINDDRNGEQITVCELREIFKTFYKDHFKLFSKMREGFEAVIHDINSKINVPFIVKYDRQNRELDLVAKTVMRKPNFKSPDRKLSVNTGI